MAATSHCNPLLFRSRSVKVRYLTSARYILMSHRHPRGHARGASMRIRTTTSADDRQPQPQAQARAQGHHRPHLKDIADTTLQAIAAGSITFAGVPLDLTAKVRFSNHNTRYYLPHDNLLSGWAGNVPRSPRSTPEVSILEISTLDGARRLYDSLPHATSSGRISVLNFASATRPGGGFLSGAPAQEESIARSSTLYPSLMTDTAQEFYKLHGRDRKGGFYYHAMIYSPSVVLFRNDAGDWVAPFEVDVLTSAAVNAGDVRRKNGRTSDPEIEKTIEAAMRERMARILALMEHQGAKNLVLGSFGTGVFKNNVTMVAKIWAELLTSPGARYSSSFDRIVFAILGTATFTTFKRAFEDPSSSNVEDQEVWTDDD